MRIQLHGYSYGIENVEKHNISVSRLTNEKLHLLEIRLNIDNDEVQNFKKLFNDCNNGDLVIIDQDPEIDNHRFKGKICSSSSSNMVDYNTFIIELEECNNKSIDTIEIEGMCLKPYEISQKISKNAVIINANDEDIDVLSDSENLKYCNEYGGFSNDGKEYLIKANKDNQLPTVWSHIMANKKFGTLVTESMGGYTWYKNSRLNRVTAWENQPNFDIPSEIIYLKDQETKKVWSLGLNPMPDNKNYNVVYGFGYTKFIHKSDGIEQELEVFVPREDSVKIQILKLKNMNLNRKKLKLVYYMKPVLGEDELKSNGYIDLKYDKNNNIICAQNLYNSEFKNDVIYVSNSEKMQSYTGDKNFLLGNGNKTNPDSQKHSAGD
mgnify:CR=1 FL=1